MTRRHLTLAVALAVSLFASASLPGHSAPVAGPAQFRAHDVEPNFRGGYAVNVADFNKDGRIDVIANSLQAQELAWYENPTWERHVIVPEMQSIVNQAMEDIDNDGIPEVAFQSSFAMQAANSPGYNWIARRQGDPRKPWKSEKIDTFPTSHHVAWADLDGDGKKELLNAPLIGEKSLAPTYDQDKASVFWYDQKTWTRHAIAQDIPGIIHRVRPVNWDSDKRAEFLVASFEGIALYKATGSGDAMKFEKTLLSSGHSDDKAPRLGASDVGVGLMNGSKFFASVEPWHGNEVVVYNDAGGKWQRRVIYDKVTSGHEIAVVDLNGDGRSDVVANDNSRPTEQRPNATPGVHVFYAPDNPVTGTWTYQRIEEKFAMNSCVGADLNSDTRMDLVCTGAGGVTRWYENLGQSPRPAPTGTSNQAKTIEHLLPRRDATGVMPSRFEWTPIAGADRYAIGVWNEVDGLVWRRDDLRDPSIAVPAELRLEPSTYFWSVTALREGRAIAESGRSAFVVLP